MNIDHDTTIHHVGKVDHQGKIQCNPYLLITESAVVLFEPGNIRDFDVVVKKVRSHVDLGSITHCIVSHPDVDLAGSLPKFEQAGMKAEIITSRASLLFLTYFGITNKTVTIESLNYQLDLGDGRMLSFMPVPFLHHPGSFMSYDEQTHTLFSGDLFGAVDFHESNRVDEGYLERMCAFHERYMPSSDFVRPVMKTLSTMQIERILPQHGSPILSSWVDRAIRTLYDLDFYNNRYIIDDTDHQKRSFNFKAMLDHMIIRLKTIADDEEIRELFEDSDIRLHPKTLAIEKTTLEHYKLWNYFFHHIYVRKGLSWLLVLESLVKKYVRMYGIKRPTIYESRLKDKLDEVDKLSENQRALEEEIGRLGDQLEDNREKIKASRIAGLYNEDTLKEMLKQDMATGNINDHALVIVQVRELPIINRKYSTEQGDETLRKLSQLIDATIKDRGFVYKQNGPGLLLYFRDASMKDIRDMFAKIRYGIGHSDMFIETITLRAGGVFFAEINTEAPLEKIDLAFQKAEQRLQLAQRRDESGIVFSNIEGSYMAGTILLIDEDEINQGIVSRIFEREGYAIIIKNDVYQALEIIESQPVDIIISEINLAKLDGFALKDKLNKTKEHADLPFLMISHNKTPMTIRRANELGVEFVMEKPIYADELLGIVKRIRLRRGQQ